MNQRENHKDIREREKFNSNFGFLMVVIGSAVGLGNLWGFPYKMGKGGGFAFLLLYLVLAVIVGYSGIITILSSAVLLYTGRILHQVSDYQYWRYIWNWLGIGRRRQCCLFY